jgi:hypothetical protein
MLWYILGVIVAILLMVICEKKNYKKFSFFKISVFVLTLSLLGHLATSFVVVGATEPGYEKAEDYEVLTYMLQDGVEEYILTHKNSKGRFYTFITRDKESNVIEKTIPADLVSFKVAKGAPKVEVLKKQFIKEWYYLFALPLYSERQSYIVYIPEE